MQSAEKLIAERGIENVAIREIVSAAGQKNESALQYHFDNLSGLLRAIASRRAVQTQEKRAELLAQLLEETQQPQLRQLCEMMVKPVFELARSSVDFRRFVRAFGHEIALTETSALSKASAHGGGGESGKQLHTLLKHALPLLDSGAYQRRMEAAVRLCSASLYHQARQKSAFRGPAAELYYHSLIDALVGLLSAPQSQATRKLARQLQSRD